MDNNCQVKKNTDNSEITVETVIDGRKYIFFDTATEP